MPFLCAGEVVSADEVGGNFIMSEEKQATQFKKEIERKNFKYELVKDATFTGEYDFPKLKRTLYVPRNIIPFNLAKTEQHPSDKWLHFFIDDYQFERIWNYPNKYIPLLNRFEGVISTDFSMFLKMSKAQRIWNCYRNRVMDYWMQSLGLNVVPVVEWAKYSELSWCMDGIPRNSTVAVGFYGTMKDVRSRYGLLKGIERICTELSPHTLVCYGKEIKCINSMCKKVIFLDNYCKTVKKRVK